MDTSDHSFRKLLPSFVISAGSQVVLKVSKICRAASRSSRRAVWVSVLESPPNNHDPYIVRFADGETVQATSAS